MTGPRAGALLIAATLLGGCAAGSFGGGTPVFVATADGSVSYRGTRSQGLRADGLALTSSSGSACGGDLHPTTDRASKLPATFGAIVCEDGKFGVLLLSEPPGSSGGTVSGVMDRRSVSGHWGGASGAGA